MAKNKLTITSYAILGQLALRSWSAYELTSEMKRNFHYFWPRAESGIYSEIKQLERLGLAQSKRASTGKRGRTVYSITAKGKDVLSEWLSTSPSPFSLEFEGLLRVFFANFGTQEQLLSSLEHVKTSAEEMIEVAAHVGREYLKNNAPFQKHVHTRVFAFHFLLHYAHWYKEWAEQVVESSKDWDGLSQTEKSKKALELIAADMKKFKLPVDVE